MTSFALSPAALIRTFAAQMEDACGGSLPAVRRIILSQRAQRVLEYRTALDLSPARPAKVAVLERYAKVAGVEVGTYLGVDDTVLWQLIFALRNALHQIVARSNALRQGGPAPEDLQELSDALEEVANIAAKALEAQEKGAKNG